MATPADVVQSLICCLQAGRRLALCPVRPTMSVAAMEFVDVDDARRWVAALRAGACTAWALSPVNFARVARRRVELVLTGLSLPGDVIENLLVGVAELAANAVRHGGTVEHIEFDERGEPVAGLPEVWLYIRQAPSAGRHELVVTVFDTGRGVVEVRAPDLDEIDAASESGRGLHIVAALAAEGGGCWGLHPSRSRLGRSRVPGTAAWLALPLPDCPHAGPQPPVPSPTEAARQLAAHLTTRGVHDLITRSNGLEAHVSCGTGLTVWAHHGGAGTFQWSGMSGWCQRPLVDVVDVAESVIAQIELASRHRSNQETGCPSI